MPGLAEQVLLGHDRVLEDQLTRVAGPPAHLVLLLARPDARRLRQVLAVPHAQPAGGLAVHRVLGDDEAGDALVAPAGLGPGGHREDLAHAGVGDEDLGAVEDVVVALVHRRRGGAPRVAAGARLGEAEPAEHPAGGQQRDVAPPLLFGAELDDGGGAQVGVGADGERVARVHLGHFVDRDVVGELIHSRAAQLLRPGHAEETELAHLLHVVPRKGGGAVELARDRGDLGAGELAHHVAHLIVLLVEVQGEIHGLPGWGVRSGA